MFRVSKVQEQMITSILLTLFLGFIDEGYYNFRWMLKFYNWVALAVYAFAIFGGQRLLFILLFKKKKGSQFSAANFTFGSALGIGFVVFFVFKP